MIQPCLLASAHRFAHFQAAAASKHEHVMQMTAASLVILIKMHSQAGGRCPGSTCTRGRWMGRWMDGWMDGWCSHMQPHCRPLAATRIAAFPPAACCLTPHTAPQAEDQTLYPLLEGLQAGSTDNAVLALRARTEHQMVRRRQACVRCCAGAVLSLTGPDSGLVGSAKRHAPGDLTVPSAPPPVTGTCPARCLQVEADLAAVLAAVHCNLMGPAPAGAGAPDLATAVQNLQVGAGGRQALGLWPGVIRVVRVPSCCACTVVSPALPTHVAAVLNPPAHPSLTHPPTRPPTCQAHLSAHMVEEEALVLPRLAAAYSRDALVLHAKNFEAAKLGVSFLPPTATRMHKEAPYAGAAAAGMGAAPTGAGATGADASAGAGPMGATVTSGVPGGGPEAVAGKAAAPARTDTAGEAAPMSA